MESQETDHATAPRPRPRPMHYPKRFAVRTSAETAAAVDALSAHYGGRGEVLRLALAAGLPILRERARSASRRRAGK